MLRQFGVEEERVQIVWASASEGRMLAEAVDRMTEQVRALGPLRWKQTVLSGNGSVELAAAGHQEEVTLPEAEEV
jgi:F420-non-reducing hydrogenase iron-sulfur subunit